jgi:hypothetical protein
MSEHSPGDMPPEKTGESSADEHRDHTRQRNEKRVKLLFLGVVIIAAVLIYRQQTRPEGPPAGWATDLDQAAEQARQQDKNVLVWLTSGRSSQAVEQMKNITLAKKHNRQAIAEGFVPVYAVWNEQLGERFNVDASQLPTMVIVTPAGRELNRRSGYVGEVPFRQQFLSLETVEPPPGS